MVTTRRVIEPIERPTLTGMVTERLRELLVQGAFEPGSQLGEAELAEQFGVSRGPVREAILRLVNEGLLKSEPHRGAVVPVMKDGDVADIYLARGAIEAAALRVVLASAERDRIVRELRAVVEKMRRAEAEQRWDDIAELDMSFHASVVTASGSSRLLRMYSALLDETRACLSMTTRYPGREDLVREHEQLAQLLDSADEDGALDALHRHFAESVISLRKSFETA